jgi:hypothetical protein
MAFLKKHGQPYTRIVPLGHRCEVIQGLDGRKQVVWVRDATQCAILREIYTRHHDYGHSFGQIAADLVRRGIKDQNGYPWSWWVPSARKWVLRKIRKAYWHAARVLEETGCLP